MSFGHRSNWVRDDDGVPYDVFICHASEDKASVVRPLAAELETRGISVWLDEGQLTIGDSLRGKIDHGLRESRFGVVVLSPSFFGKRWTQWELDGLVDREVTSGAKVVLSQVPGRGVTRRVDRGLFRPR